ncbi:RND transporter [Thauera sinica]|nr:RND transporter [Thauera sp. K11]
MLLATLALSACMTVGPDYHAPHVAVPAAWSVAGDGRGSDPAVLAAWWRQFDDPVLDGLVADALAANLDLATARAQLREARARRLLAGAQLGPSVDASGSARRSRSSAESGSGSAVNLYSAGFDASWEPDVFGGLRRGVEAAEADLGAAVESLRDVRVSLLAEVVLNYVELRTTERRLAVTEASVAAREETHALTGWRLQAGLVSELDTAQALTELESARAALPALRTAIVEARNRLAVLCGRAPGELAVRLSSTETTGVAIPLAAEAVFAGIPADVLRQRPDVRAGERRLAAQTARLGEAQAARYPSFSLSGSIGVEALRLGALGNSGAVARSLLAGVTAPIFDSGRIAANVEIQDALLEQARVAYQGAVLTALEDVENALVAVANGTERHTQLARATAAAQLTLQIAQHRYATGLTDFLTVLDSQRTLLGLEDELASSTGDLASAQIQLYKALGGGWSSAPADEPGNAS